jgi:hypothetical protein
MSLRKGRRAAGLVALLIAAGFLATGCAASKPPLVRGARIDVSYSELISYDASGAVVARAPYVSKVGTDLALLTAALGKPNSVHQEKLDGTVYSSVYRWKGLLLGEFAKDGVGHDSVEVETPTVNGVTVVALNRYRVNGDFPTDGAKNQCALSVVGPGITGLLDALNPPRVNAVTPKRGPGAVGFFEDYRHHGYTSGFMAPRLAEGC